MAFLTKDELKTKRRPEVIQLIVAQDDDTITEVINQEIGIFKDYLSNFNTSLIFQAEGEGRNKTVLKYLKACVVFELYCIRAGQFDETLKYNYEEAMNWLEKVSAGKINTTLPMPESENGTDPQSGFMKTGSNKKYSNGW